MTPPKNRVILYARFSPRPNAADCDSCERQLTELRAYANRYDYEVAGEFSDEALSGSDDWDDRPGMFSAAGACKRGYIFVVRAFDRLFRDTRKGLIFACMIEQKGARIRSITEEAASLDTPEAEMMRTIFLAVAEYQRKIGNARTRAKMLAHQANGRRMSKYPPWGYKVDPYNKARITINPSEIGTTDTIVQMHKGGRNNREIALVLTERGVNRRGSTEWNHQVVGRILKRAGYPKKTRC